MFRVVGRRSTRSRPVVLCRRGAEGGAQAGEVDRAPGLFGYGVDDRPHYLECGQYLSSDRLGRTHGVDRDEDAAFGVPGNDWVRDVVVELEACADDVLGVIGAMFECGPGEQSTRELLVVGLQVQRDVRGHLQLHSDSVGCTSLRHGARDPIQDIAGSSLFCCDEGLPDHAEHDLVGHQFTTREELLNGPA